MHALNIPKTTDALYFYSTRELKQSGCISLKKYDSNFLCDHMMLYRPLRLPSDPSPQPLISRIPQVQSHLGYPAKSRLAPIPISDLARNVNASSVGLYIL